MRGVESGGGEVRELMISISPLMILERMISAIGVVLMPLSISPSTDTSSSSSLSSPSSPLL